MTRGRCVLVAVSVAEIHRDPSHVSEITTQALMGERLQVTRVADGGRWLRVTLPDGYRGWVRSWLVTPDRPAWPGGRLVEFDEPFGWVTKGPRPGAEPVSDIVIGVRLAVAPGGKSGWSAVELPDGRTGYLPARQLLGRAPRRATAARRPPRPEALLATARRFRGVPYVWGGKSPRGFDCSGLVQLVHELHGLQVPRDARDQRAWLERRARGGGPASSRLLDPLAVPPGGLLFFGADPKRATHVGFSLGEGRFLHAQGRVREQSMDPHNALFHKDLREVFQVGFPPVTDRAGA